MADVDTAPSGDQHEIELPNGVILSGMGGDPDAIQEAIEERTPAPEPPPEESSAPEPPKEPEPPKAAASAEPKVDKRTRGQKRFDDLTAKAEEAARRAEAAEAKARELEAKLAAGTPPPAAAPAPPAVSAAAPVVDAAPVVRAKPTEAEVGTKYASYGDFVEDLSDWKAEQRVAAAVKDLDARSTARIEAERATRSRTDRASEAMTRGRTVFPDFDAVLASVDDIKLPPAYQEAIMSVDKPEHVMYALGKDRTLLTRLLTIQNGVQLGLELAKLVPSAAVASPASTAPVVRTTNAPAPVQPVGSSARTTSPSSAELADHGDDYDSSGYRERRARELGRKPVR